MLLDSAITEMDRLKYSQNHAGKGPMTIDTAKTRFDELCLEWNAVSKKIETEQDARFQVIDRILIEVMGWQHTDVRTESHGQSGYVDYLLSRNNRNCLVIEAKRQEKILVDTRNPNLAHYKLGGPALKSASGGISQARQYCMDHGVPFAVLTTGFEWVFFVALRTDGLSPLEGTAIVFPGLDAISKNFATFYDLLSKTGFGQELIRVRLQEAEGLEVQHSDELYSVADPNRVRLLQKSDMAADLDQVFNEFFSTMSGESDPEMLAKCFVETKESKEADATLDKITRTLTNHIKVVDGSQGVALARHIADAVEFRRGEFVLVIGNKGAGKTTFIDRFFRLVLDRQIREQCLVARIDLADSTGDLDNLNSWLTECLKAALERELFHSLVPTYEELQGVFWREYNRWRRGEHKFLYEKDREQFKIDFGKHVYELVDQHPDRYVIALLSHAIRGRQLLPCLVFDNTDHFPQQYQEKVFQVAQSFFRRVLSFVICPITDRTIWQLSKQGPLQSYVTTQFYLPVPSTKDVLSKRVDFIKEKLDVDQTQGGEYFSRKGIRLNISDIQAFAFCVEEIFIKTEYLGRVVGWLSNHDIRRGLQIAQRIITSPILSVEDLVKLYITGNRAFIEERKVRQALILGNYNGFVQSHSDFVLNLFQVASTSITTPLAKLSILRVLMDRESQATSPEESYMTIEDIVNYCEPIGIARSAAIKHCREFLDYRLIEPYDPTDLDLYMGQRVKVTHAGRIHSEFALEDETYVVQMALATTIRSPDVAAKGREIYYSRHKMTRKDWINLIQLFVEYCQKEDKVFVNIPETASYTGQANLRDRFIKR